MIRNFITISLRSIMRSKVYSFINIAGLSIGVSCCLLLALYIEDEMSYDKHHRNGENIYRVLSSIGIDKTNHTMGTTSAPIVWGIKDEVPEFEQVTRLLNPPGVDLNLIRYDNNQFYEPNGYIADSTVFDIFAYDFIEGNPRKALTEANSVVISEALAKKLFNTESALNKMININQGGPSGDYTVTGVYREKGYSHIQASFFISMTSTSGWTAYIRGPQVADEWAGQNFLLSYVRLKPGHDVAAVTSKMNEVFLKHGADDLKAMGMQKRLALDPVQDIYLYSNYSEQSPRITYLYVIASIGIFILLLACINFMNLSTAKATKRANEVGLRKTLGAYRSSLIGQFLGEAMVTVFVAILISTVLVQLALPAFNNITGKHISLQGGNVIFIVGALIATTLVTGLIAGSYPAFYLSSFQPAKVLKGKSVLQSSNGLLRKSLVVVQFVIAITLACGMIVINRQLNFIQEKNLGFEAEHKIVFPLRTSTAQNNFTALQNELSKVSSIHGVTGTHYIPGSYIFTDFNVYPQGSSVEQAIHFRNNTVEPNYLDVLGIQLIAGKNFPEVRPVANQKTKTIVNREGIKQLGFTIENAIGQSLYFEWQGARYEYEIIGVMEDFHQVSLKEEIFPLLFFVQESPTPDFAIAEIGSDNIQNTLASCEAVWKTLNSDTPFEYTFLDQTIQKQYDEDRKVAKVISSFTTIAMIISCLGLYGLSMFMAERRFKEIGVRKVMGATVKEIVALMSGEFIKFVGVAIIIAVPVSIYAMNKWLDGFAYKTTPDVSIFIYAGLAALLIAVLTVSFESIRAAMGNPVKALRNE
jgi:putative ABC transport system permease protein